MSAFVPAMPERIKILREFLPFFLIHGSRHLVILAGFLLILNAQGIIKQKKTAWWVTFVLILASSGLHISKGLDFEEAVILVLIVGLMLVFYPRFRARSDTPTILNAFRMLGLVIIVNIAYGVIGFYLLNRQLGRYGQWLFYLKQTLTVMFTNAPLPDPNLLHRGHLFLNSLWVMWEFGLIIFVIMLLKPVIYRHTTWHSDHQKASEIAQAFGCSSLVYFTLWEDKLYFFNHSKTVYIAFAQAGNVAVALGDPVGRPEDIKACIAEFIEFCSLNSWQYAFYQVKPDYLESYKQFGLSYLDIGDEAIINLPDFDMIGSKFKYLRYIQRHFTREGYKTISYEPPLSDSLLIKLKEISDDWLARKGGEETAFSLGWFDIKMLRQNQVITIENSEGNILAFANFIPMYRLPYATIDMMRYFRQVPGGIMDYLFVESILHFKNQGKQGFSMGLAPLAHAGHEQFSNVADKTIHLIYKNFHSFKGLYEFKSKYSPRWEPRYLVFPNPIALPAIIVALIKVGDPRSLSKLWRWVKARLSWFKKIS
jgi:phosphatidylglycerol lysyltransferase